MQSRVFIASMLILIAALFLAACRSGGGKAMSNAFAPQHGAGQSADSPPLHDESSNANAGELKATEPDLSGGDSIGGSNNNPKGGLWGGGFVADEVIALLESGATKETAESIAKEIGAELLDFIPELRAALFKFDIPDSRVPSFTNAAGKRLVSSMSPSSVPALDSYLSAVKAHSQVRHAEPHYFGQAALTPDDEYYSMQYYIHGTKVNLVWDETTGGPGVTIAILDSGVDYGHPEFAGKIHPAGKDFMNPPAAGDGRATPLGSGSYHGSNVAGIALATGNNEIGIAGANWGAKALSLRIDSIAGEPTGWLVIDCVRAMVYTLQFPEVRVINISAVYPTGATLLDEASRICTEYGKIVIAAAGNEGLDTPSLCAPAYFDSVIAVGGTMGLSELWADANGASNYGVFLDILAPATNILTINSNGEQRNYLSLHGTSFSAPLISGIAALMLSKNPGLTVDDVKAALSVGATSFDTKHPDKAGKMGAGLVNALAAFSAGPQFGLNVTGSRSEGIYHTDLFFNRRLSPEAACDVSHYSFSPARYVYGAVLMDGGMRVRLESEALTPNGQYQITFSGLTATDGGAMSPPVQQSVVIARSATFDVARAANGATAFSEREFGAEYAASRAIDGFAGTFWYSEVESGSNVDLYITFPRVEYISRIQIEGRSTGITDPAYASVFELHAAAIYNTLRPELENEFIRMLDDESMPGGLGTLTGKSSLVIEFPPVQAKHLVVRFVAGTDNILDSDDSANGVSVARVFVSRTFSEGDVFSPVIRSISPVAAPLGATVQIFGDYFGAAHPESWIYFGDIQAVVLNWTDTAITALVPYNPLSLPVEMPPVFPPDAEASGDTGAAAEIPPAINAVIPPMEDAESGDIYLSRGGFASNKLFFAVTE